MSRDFLPELQALDSAYVAEIAGRILGRPGLREVDWNVTPLQAHLTNQVTGGLFRFAGTGLDGGRPLEWSAVLKIALGPGHDIVAGRVETTIPDDPSHYNYWRREVEVYRSGLVSGLPGVRAPRIYSVEERAPNTFWIWMEEVRECIARPWRVEEYALPARHLGVFNGAALAGRPLPDYPWLARNWLRSWVASSDLWAADPTDELWGRPMVQEFTGPDFRGRYERAMAGRAALLDLVERLPHGLAHQDAWHANLLIAQAPGGGGETVAIDWAFTGPAPIGIDASNILCCATIFYALPPQALRELDAAIYPAYAEGLRSGGWDGDERLARLGYTATAYLRWCISLTRLGVARADESKRTTRNANGHLVEEVVAHWLGTAEYLVALREEADRLVEELSTEGKL